MSMGFRGENGKIGSKKIQLKLKEMSCCVFTFMLIAVLGIALPGYAETSSEKTSIEEVKQETQDLIQTLKAYSADQRDEAIQETRSALKNLDKRIDALETRIDSNWDNMNRPFVKKRVPVLKRCASNGPKWPNGAAA